MQHVVCAALLGISVGAASPVLAQQFTFATGDRILQGYNPRAGGGDDQSVGEGVDAAGQLPNSPYQSNLAGRDTLPRALTQTATYKAYAPPPGIGSAGGFGTALPQGNAPGGAGDNPGIALNKPPGSYQLQVSTLQPWQFGGDCATCSAVHQGAAVDGAGLATPGTSGGDGGKYTFKFQTGETQLAMPGSPPVPPLSASVAPARVTPTLTPTIVTTPKIVAPSIVAPVAPVIGPSTHQFSTRQDHPLRSADAIRGTIKAN